MRRVVPGIDYCSGDCRDRHAGVSPWRPFGIDGPFVATASVCLYCGDAPVSACGLWTCNTRPCAASHAAWLSAYRSTGGRLERLFLPDVALKSGGWCTWCGTTLDRTTQLDHIVPRARGGDHTLDNTQLVHARCNMLKGFR